MKLKLAFLLGLACVGCNDELTIVVQDIPKLVAAKAELTLTVNPGDDRAGVVYRWSIVDSKGVALKELEGGSVKWVAPEVPDACSKIFNVKLAATYAQSPAPIEFAQTVKVVAPACLIIRELSSPRMLSKLAMGKGGAVWVGSDLGLDLVDDTLDTGLKVTPYNRRNSLMGSWTSPQGEQKRWSGVSAIYSGPSMVGVGLCKDSAIGVSCSGAQFFNLESDLTSPSSWTSFSQNDQGPGETHKILDGGSYVRSIDVIDGKTVLGAANGLTILNPNNTLFKKLLPAQRISTVKQDSLGGIWVGTGRFFGAGEGIYIYKGWSDGNPVRIDGSQWGGTGFYHVTDIKDFEFDSQGNAWVGIGDGRNLENYGGDGVVRYTSGSSSDYVSAAKWTPQLLQFENNPISLNALAVDRADNAWVAHNLGLDRIPGSLSRSARSLGRNRAAILGCAPVLDLAYDKERNVLWATCKNLGLMRIHLDFFQ